jgi:hypothetical protein
MGKLMKFPWGKALLETGISNVALPQNLILSAGMLYEDFETAGDWGVYQGTVEADTDNYKTGTQSIKLTSNVGATTYMNKVVNWDLSGDWHSVDFWYYVHNALADYAYDLRIKLGNDSSVFANYYRTISNTRTEPPGWHFVSIPKAYFTQQNGGSWNNPIIRVRFEFTSAGGVAAAISVDDLVIGTERIPAIIFRFDDGYTSQYTAYGYMRPFNIPGSIALQTSLGFITWAHLQEMDAARWAICNHTDADTNLTTLTEAQQEAQIDGGISDLTVNGLARCSKYLTYPGGASNADTITACQALGILIGMNSSAWSRADGVPGPVLPKSYLFDMVGKGLNSSTSVASAEALVDEAIADQTVAVFYWHQFGGVGQWSLADFYSFVDYVRIKIMAGLIYPITYDDYYNLTVGQVNIPGVQ